MKKISFHDISNIFRNITQPYFLLSDTFCGENLHLESYPISWSNVIEIWYNESRYFTYGEWTSSDDDTRTDRYTQVTCVQAIHTVAKEL
jgi:hypothetical protein